MVEKIKLELKDKPLSPIRRPKSFFIRPKIVAIVVFLIFIIFVCWYFWHEVRFLIKAPELKVLQPPADISATVDSFEIVGATDPSAYLTINDEKIYLDKDGNFKFELHLSSGVNIIKVEAKNRFNKTNQIIRRILYEKQNEPAN